MKQLSIFFICCLVTIASVAQPTYSVSFTVHGNKDGQIYLDGQDITNEITVAVDPVVLTISGLTEGQHDLQVVQPANGGNPGLNKTTAFNLRAGYEMTIVVNTNGSVNIQETSAQGGTTPVLQGSVPSQTGVPMTDTRFMQLYQDIKRQMLGPAKMSSLSVTFARNDNYFTVSQVMQLIQLVSSESNRLQLAKSSYHCVTDPVNFNRVEDLIFSQAGKDDLRAYVDTHNNASQPASTSRSAMSQTDFNAIYRDVQRQWKPGGKLTTLTNAFANAANAFTVSQAKQLIQLVSSEMNRLELAKSAYRKITDPANFEQLYDLFVNQSSRDELAAYVNANR